MSEVGGLTLRPDLHVPFGVWRTSVRRSPGRRGGALWRSKRDAYRALVEWDSATAPTLDRLLERGGPSRSAYFNHFAPQSREQWIKSDELWPDRRGSMDVCITEAKAWTFEPYLAGAREVRGLTTAAREDRAVIESILRCLISWTRDYPLLAGWKAAEPPVDAVYEILSGLPRGDRAPDDALDLARGMVTAVLSEPDEGDITLLNRVRPDLERAMGHRPPEWGPFIEALAEFEEAIATDPDAAAACRTDVVPALQRVLRILEGVGDA